MAPSCRKPSPDFDFLMGIWKCRHRYLRRRLAGCNDWIEFDGSCAARKILDGTATWMKPTSPCRATAIAA